MKYFAVLSLLVVMACSEDTGEPDEAAKPSALAIAAGAEQSAEVGTAVPVVPAVHVTDAYGRGVPTVPVTFAVTAGGGTVEHTTAHTDIEGIARAGTWTLGTQAGINRLTATVVAGREVVFVATARAGAPAAMSAHAGRVQTGAIGQAVSEAPLTPGKFLNRNTSCLPSKS